MQFDWEQVQEIFLTALEQEPAARADFVRARCNGNSSTYDEVMSLLRSHDEANHFIEEPLVPVNAASFDITNPELQAGEVIGDYTIVSLIGSAGMGEVYLANDNEFDRQVAIKLIKRGLVGAESIRQFRREERLLAALTHPNIACFYGGAVLPDGVPYFIMEYVAGTRLDRHCEELRLTIRERLELFRKVCGAVHFAHQHLIVHRDLKPSNILVTEQGEPKLLDFGIGKLLQTDKSSPELTITVAPIMTPEYASPEHIRGESATTSSDIYSLGVLLYEILSGERPYKLSSHTPSEIEKIICETEPVRPSAVTAHSQQSAIRAQNLRGDLDKIVLMAMRKEPARRYASAAQLSEDIRRHLAGMPVAARRDTLSYRAGKFIKRNKLAVIAGLLIVTTLLAGLIATLWQSRVARQERDAAQRINAFLQDMLGAASPENKGLDVKVKDVLGEASRRAQIELASEPKVMADVLLTIGRTYVSIDQVAAAEANFRIAVATSLKANGELNETTTASMAWLGLALAYLDKTADGEQVSRRAVRLERKLHPQGDETLAIGLYSLGLNMLLRGEAKASVPILEEACEVAKRYLGANHGYYVAGLGALGLAREKSGDFDKAETILRQAVEAGRKLEYRYQLFHAQAAAYLGELLTEKANYQEAEAFLHESELLYRQRTGDSTFSIGAIKQDLGDVYLHRKDYARAEEELRKSLDILQKNLSPRHPSTLKAGVLLGLTLTRENRATEAEPYLRKALELQGTLPTNPIEIAFTEGALGECLLVQKRFAEAAPLLRTSYAQVRARRGDQDALTIEAARRLKSLPPMPAR
ncbi:MAG TPA: serine/threonine-protein kinase [Chthoniobacterales bacterium]|jgi:serine/threonine-protein kinase